MTLLTELIQGRFAHRAPLACFEDLSAELAGRRVAHVPHTIWQTVRHLDYWMELEVRSIEGPEVIPPDDWGVSWPVEAGPVDEAAWRAEIARFRTNLERLIAFAEAGPDLLARVIHPKHRITAEHAIGVLATHNSYHLGQIVTIRQALQQWR
jgi:hypothetical protein